MTDLLRTGSDFLAAQRRASLAHVVVYRRGALSVSLPATRGRSDFQATDAQGVLVQERSVDWLVTAADLVLNSASVEPERGDRVEETVGGVTRTYEVMAPGNGPPWRWSDPGHKTMRVHSKLVDEE